MNELFAAMMRGEVDPPPIAKLLGTRFAPATSTCMVLTGETKGAT